MLQAIEAVIETNGIVRLKEFVYPVRPVRAVITLLEPLVAEPVIDNGNVSRVLALLNSSAFKNAQAGNPVSMEAVIQANRTAWGD
ncbi:MAG: hypothetical protein DRR08_31115 [Candidatus Parabeggiatoa sp. nov. 2]|nr:MAG: hypothetical protein DRR08_31115 [Gammaproteobacteria bacterium]HEC85017.1 hypothetical protein [Thioploca sp.]